MEKKRVITKKSIDVGYSPEFEESSSQESNDQESNDYENKENESMGPLENDPVCLTSLYINFQRHMHI
jgi:hypothetical protein